MSIAVIAGLGNPGPEYDGTRHNVGFRIVDAVAAATGNPWKKEKRFLGEVARVTFAGSELWLLKPMTYMNDSGRSLQAFAQFRKLTPEQFVVAYDEIQVPLGGLKISLSGSAGGHNGIASLLSHLGDGFTRFRAGIGPKSPDKTMTAFVLDRFREEERPVVENALPVYVDALARIVREGPRQAMNLLNRRDQQNECCGNPA